MKIITVICCLTLASAQSFADPLKKAELLPDQDEATIPGTNVPLEELNTAPGSPQLQEEELESRTILKAREEKERELKRENDIKVRPGVQN